MADLLRVHRIEIDGELDRHTAELLRLEVRRLARQHGLDVSRFAVEPAHDPSDESAQ